MLLRLLLFELLLRVRSDSLFLRALRDLRGSLVASFSPVWPYALLSFSQSGTFAARRSVLPESLATLTTFSWVSPAPSA